MTWPFAPLQMFGYDLVMVDVPTRFGVRSEKGEGKSSQAKYGCMSIEEAAAMPIGQLLGRDGVLFLWWTWPLLLHGGDPARHFKDADAARSPAGELIKAWGLRYVTGGAWHKKTRHGKTAFGTGYRARSSCEPFLLAVTGEPDTSRAERNLFEGLAREHSRKPEEAFAWCERYIPGARRAEIFSRASRPGWSTWGYEAGKFDPVVTLGAAA
jgi:N6-adenosine-specific RNA methylase IME4